MEEAKTSCDDKVGAVPGESDTDSGSQNEDVSSLSATDGASIETQVFISNDAAVTEPAPVTPEMLQQQPPQPPMPSASLARSSHHSNQWP